MYSLKHDVTVCSSCPTVDCLVKCQYIKADKETAREEMVKIGNGDNSFLLEECVCCYGCEEYCQKGNHPCFLISEQREAKGILTSPRPITDHFIMFGIPHGDYEQGEIKEVALSKCYAEPLKEIASGKLFDDIASSYVAGDEVMCPPVYLHFGKTSVIKERLPRLINKIHGLGIKKLICLHDECYGAYTSLASSFGMDVPFEPVHYMEHVFNRLKELDGEITPLKCSAVYQRPCSSRLSPEMHHFVKDICDLIGVKLLQRKYQDENSLCCGEPLRVADFYETANDVQQKNLSDMVAAQPDYCIFNCFACQEALGEKVSKRGITPIHIINLVRMALNEPV